MVNKDETASLSLTQNPPERGAGGKYRNPPSRKPPLTPYTRPQPRSRWLSKLVDPACRLISGGATRIFPSLFSKSPESSLPAPNNQEEEEDQDVLNTQAEENTEDDGGLNLGESRSIGVSGSSSAANRSKKGSEFDGCKLDKRGDTTDDGLSEIEQLVKGKTFSRDEINCLIEIIRSRTAALPEQENKYLSKTMNGDSERSIAAFENPKKSKEEKQEDLSTAKWGTSTTLLQSSVQGEVGASPIEIAKAYMRNRTSEVGLGSKSILSKDERATLKNDEFSLKPFIPSISPKPSTCWPGAMLPDQHGYLTPLSERERYGLHNFPRSPYSKTIFPKSMSKSKLTQGDGNRGLKTSTPLQHLQTPTYGQSRRHTLDNGHGSVGPIRRIRHKVVEESPGKGSTNFNFSLNGASWVGNSSILEVFSPAVKKNLELGGTSGSLIFQAVDRKSPSSELGVPQVHPHSSQMARTILEHLERNPPTPKDKSAELKLATLWKKTQTSNNTTAIPIERNSFLPLGGLDSFKKTDQGEEKNSAQVNKAGGNTVPPRENAKEPRDTVDTTSSASVSKVDSIFTIQQGGSAGNSQNFSKTQDFEIKSKNENDSETVPNAADVEVLILQRKPPSHSVGSKPVLPSISVEKPNQRWTFSSDNSTGFTFPVSKSTGVLSEPPTPSILPSFAASGEHQPEDGPPVPSYSFGLNRPTPLIFAFPSINSAPFSDDTSDLKFNFGSDKTRRISFSSVGKYAICY